MQLISVAALAFLGCYVGVDSLLIAPFSEQPVCPIFEHHAVQKDRTDRLFVIVGNQPPNYAA